MQNAECKMQNEELKRMEDRAREYKFELDTMQVKCMDLEDEVTELKCANRQKEARIHWLEGKVEAFEYCVKNGRAK